MKKKVLIYPYVEQHFSLVKSIINLKPEYELLLASLKGWGYEGKKIVVKGREVEISSEYEKCCLMCDEIWFVNVEIEVNETKFIYDRMEFAKENHKVIRYFRKWNSTAERILGQRVEKQYDIPTKLNIINVPIIMITELYKDSGGFDVELAMKSQLEATDYKIVQIGSRPEGELVGMKKFPEFMLNKRYKEKEKITLFNQYIKQIEIEEKPDCIIIGVPGGVKTYSREVPDEFGINCFMVSCAITSDIAVLSIPYVEYSIEEVYELKRFMWEKYGIYIDYINLIHKKIVGQDTDLTQQMIYISIDSQLVDEQIEAFNDKSIFDVSNNQDAIRMKSEMIKKLEMFGEIQFV